jgi:hypothetical protein
MLPKPIWSAYLINGEQRGGPYRNVSNFDLSPALETSQCMRYKSRYSSPQIREGFLKCFLHRPRISMSTTFRKLIFDKRSSFLIWR